MRLLLSVFLVLGFVAAKGQNYNNPNNTINTCTGNFYDSGGSASNYGYNLTRTTTFCSGTVGQSVIITFSAFDIESGYDFISVYDGPTTGATLIGTYTGTVIPSVFISTGTCLTFQFTSDGFVNNPGWAATITCGPSPTVLNLNTGNSGGTVNGCNYMVYDNGGAAGNYSANQDVTYTFCNPTGCLQLDLAYINTIGGGNNEGFAVYDGNSTAATALYNCGSGCNAAGTLQSSGSCLTIRFRANNNGSENRGFSAYVACRPCPPPATNNCMSGSTICTNTSFSGNSSGPGTQELSASNQGCLSTENQSSWYLFSPQTSGAFELTITPSGADDYDFAIWGPYPAGSTAASICPPSTNPIRCSWAAGTGSTGLASGSGQNSEGVGGDGFVNQLNATAGDVYVLLIDNYSSSSNPFTLNWNLTGGATLDCTVLPVEFLSLTGEAIPEGNLLTWETASEHGNAKFHILKSTDGEEFRTISTIQGAGNSNIQISYAHLDKEAGSGTTFYKIRQEDFDGKTSDSEMIAVRRTITGNLSLNAFPNPAHDRLNVELVSPEPVSAKIELFDITGKLLYQRMVSVHGTDLQELEIDSYNAGIIFLLVSTEEDGLVFTKRIMIR